MKALTILALLAFTSTACATSEDAADDPAGDSTSEDLTGGNAGPAHHPSPGTLEYMTIVVSLAQHEQRLANAVNPLQSITVGTERPALLVEKGWAYLEAHPNFKYPGDGFTYVLMKYDPLSVSWKIVELTEASDDPRPETLTWRTKHPEAKNIVRTTWGG